MKGKEKTNIMQDALLSRDNVLWFQVASGFLYLSTLVWSFIVYFLPHPGRRTREVTIIFTSLNQTGDVFVHSLGHFDINVLITISSILVLFSIAFIPCSRGIAIVDNDTTVLCGRGPSVSIIARGLLSLGMGTISALISLVAGLNTLIALICSFYAGASLIYMLSYTYTSAFQSVILRLRAEDRKAHLTNLSLTKNDIPKKVNLDIALYCSIQGALLQAPLLITIFMGGVSTCKLPLLLFYVFTQLAISQVGYCINGIPLSVFFFVVKLKAAVMLFVILALLSDGNLKGVCIPY